MRSELAARHRVSRSTPSSSRDIGIAHEKSRDAAQDARRREKLAASKRGKPRPPHVIEALRQSHLGKPLSKAARKRLSQAHRKRGTRPPWLNPAWTAEEDEAVRTLPAKEAAQKTGRSIGAVYNRRSVLRVPDGRRR